MAYQWGWMIRDPKNQFLLDTFALSEHECLDKFGQKYAAMRVENEVAAFITPFSWLAAKTKEGFKPVEVTITETVKPARKGTDND